MRRIKIPRHCIIPINLNQSERTNCICLSCSTSLNRGTNTHTQPVRRTSRRDKVYGGGLNNIHAHAPKTIYENQMYLQCKSRWSRAIRGRVGEMSAARAHAVTSIIAHRASISEPPSSRRRRHWLGRKLVCGPPCMLMGLLRFARATSVYKVCISVSYRVRVWMRVQDVYVRRH